MRRWSDLSTSELEAAQMSRSHALKGVLLYGLATILFIGMSLKGGQWLICIGGVIGFGGATYGYARQVMSDNDTIKRLTQPTLEEPEPKGD